MNRSDTETATGARGRTPPISRLHSAVACVVAVVAAVGAGHLVAGIVAPDSSPLFVVGSAVIDITPAPLKEFAIQQFGEDNKSVLLGSIGVTLLLLAIVSGSLSRSSAALSVTLILALGLVGTVAAASRPTFAVGWLAAAVTAPVAGILALLWLRRAARRAASENAASEMPKQVTWHVPDLGRRSFLVSSTAVAVGAGAAALGGSLLSQRTGAEQSRDALRALSITPNVPAPPIPAGADFAADGTPSFITPNRDFYRVDTALTPPRLRADAWQLRIHGMVDRELFLTFDDLLELPLYERTITLVCVSNEVGGPYISNANFIGVSLPDVLNEAGVNPASNQIATTSSDGWTCGTPVDAVMAEGSNAMLAIGMNGDPLPVAHGFPVRMVVPGLYGYVSATKWLVDMELTTFDAFTPYWVRRNWAARAPVKTMSRIDRPRSFAEVPAGRFIAAGIAWAQPTGIARVEVRVDGGLWQDADLSSEVNNDTWRMWRIELDVSPGNHRIECRATDRDGYTQTEQRVPPIPDGATGWHSVAFRAE
ncbi:molybdopterin-dependent oxidoreductase [Hoyosella sp. YIM 151337]|uniref:molybdopterin-dependent oxidoreductase n=1 Tax=Hoyosella sp. YIM 151337 TaxID=2992742 RepID=UPI0022359632|nr:molybdopterin-dependent oxidoreductase [Hoyosella sp. YIM 151337]MCW4355791.1 molybdopterin-dependent oxidoreductase [Hoyosella sp. YIM 151337]